MFSLWSDPILASSSDPILSSTGDPNSSSRSNPILLSLGILIFTALDDPERFPEEEEIMGVTP